jgi:hypothetical protein
LWRGGHVRRQFLASPIQAPGPLRVQGGSGCETGGVLGWGGRGFADVWKKGFFAWKYKGKRKNLDEAYQQLRLYVEDLENPRLLVVCDLNRFIVRTNFPDTATDTYEFTLAELLENKPTPVCSIAPLEVLRELFTDPDLAKEWRSPALRLLA